MTLCAYLNGYLIKYKLFSKNNQAIYKYINKDIVTIVLQISPMIRAKLLHPLFYRINTHKWNIDYRKDILVLDPMPFDREPYQIPQGELQKRVSASLKIPYLKICSEDYEDIKQKKKYNGRIIGNLNRPFLSIPVANPSLKKFYYVHFLLRTGSPHTTLTHHAMCLINGKELSDQIQFYTDDYLIGDSLIQIHPSKPGIEDSKQSLDFSNANVLGMNFLSRHKEVKLNVKFSDKTFELELI